MESNTTRHTTSSRQLYIRLLQYVRPYWKQFAGGIAAMVILALTQPALAAMLKPLLDGSFVEGDPGYILWMPIVLILLFLIRGLTSFATEIAFTWISGKVVLDLREEMFERLLSLPTSYYDHNTTGHILTKIGNNAAQVTSAATSVLTTLVQDSITVVALLGWIFYLNWKFSLSIFLIAPVIVLVVTVLAKRLRILSRKNQRAIGDFTHILEESIKGHKVIKIFGGQKYETDRFQDAANWVRRYQLKLKTAGAVNIPIVEFISSVVMGVIVYFGAQQALSGEMTVGGFVSFFTAMGLLMSPIKRLTKVNQPLQMGLAAAESTFGLINEASESDMGRQRLDAPQGGVTFRDVRFRYPEAKEEALRGISFTVEPGKTLALVGPSGGGKTTIANLVPRFYQPTDGQILLDGIDTQDIPLQELRRHLSFVSQDVMLFNDSVAANISYGITPLPDELSLIRAAKAAHALDFIERMPNGFNTMIGENGVRLSGGQRQRIAIARAILKNAPVLILDEATSALDSESERHVQAALDNLTANQTTLVIAHRLSTIEHADEILVVREGCIVERGRHNDLLALNGQYAKLYRTQFKEQAPE